MQRLRVSDGFRSGVAHVVSSVFLVHARALTAARPEHGSFMDDGVENPQSFSGSCCGLD